MASADCRRRRKASAARWIALGAGPALAVALYPARETVDIATVLLLLVVVVLTAAVLGGRGPAWTAAGLGFVAVDYVHVPPHLRIDLDRTIADLELLVVFAAVTFLVTEVSDRALRDHESLLRHQFREARQERILAAMSADVGRDHLIDMIVHEVADELELDAARYEAEPRTTCYYRIDPLGRLLHRDEPVSTPRPRLPGEPVAVRISSGRDDLGQLVLLPDRPRPVTEPQLALAADLAALLAGLLRRSD